MADRASSPPRALRAAATWSTIGDRKVLFWALAGPALILLVVASLSMGRYAIDFDRVVGILLSHVMPIEVFWTETE